jgi:hypothetical protein
VVGGWEGAAELEPPPPHSLTPPALPLPDTLAQPLGVVLWAGLLLAQALADRLGEAPLLLLPEAEAAPLPVALPVGQGGAEAGGEAVALPVRLPPPTPPTPLPAVPLAPPLTEALLLSREEAEAQREARALALAEAGPEKVGVLAALRVGEVEKEGLREAAALALPVALAWPLAL